MNTPERKRFPALTKTPLLLLLLIGFILTACAPLKDVTRTPEPVTLLLDWLETPQFAGFYVALERGYYAREGLDVTIVPLADPLVGRDIPARVAAGEAEFGVGGVTLQNAQLNGVPVTAVASIIQHNPGVLFARADSGIQSPRDFVGQRIGIKNEMWQQIIENAMAATGTSLDEATEVPVGQDMQPFFDGEVDVWGGYALDEPITARLAGIDITTIYLYEYGLAGYAIQLYTAQTNISQRQELIARFLRASLDGWNEVVRDPEGTVALLLKYYPQMGTPAYVTASIEALIPLIYTGEHPVGWITPESWAATYQGETLSPDETPTGGLNTSFIEAYYAGK